MFGSEKNRLCLVLKRTLVTNLLILKTRQGLISLLDENAIRSLATSS